MKMREEENKRSSQSSSVKRFFKKRWVFPAIYIASAAIILTGVLWYQSSSSSSDKYSYNTSDLAGKNNQPAVEVNKALENFKMPVANADQAVVKMGFYDFKASPKDQEAALVFYNNTYQPNTGIDITSKDGKAFDVTASLSGTVTRVDQDSVLGNVIEIEHDKGVVTQYQSVKDMKIKVGDQVNQGQVIATAGQSLYNKDAGTHVHFEIRKDGVAVNPTNYFNKPLAALQEEKSTNTTDDQTKTVPDAKKNLQQDQGSSPTEKSGTSTDGSTPSDNSSDSIDNTNS
ncbi:peptidoglycan DD-metalloendopeptidase family protein [Neobacillus ginsengisoli]